MTTTTGSNQSGNNTASLGIRVLQPPSQHDDDEYPPRRGPPSTIWEPPSSSAVSHDGGRSEWNQSLLSNDDPAWATSNESSRGTTPLRTPTPQSFVSNHQMRREIPVVEESSYGNETPIDQGLIEGQQGWSEKESQRPFPRRIHWILLILIVVTLGAVAGAVSVVVLIGNRGNSSNPAKSIASEEENLQFPPPGDEPSSPPPPPTLPPNLAPSNFPTLSSTTFAPSNEPPSSLPDDFMCTLCADGSPPATPNEDYNGGSTCGEVADLISSGASSIDTVDECNIAQATGFFRCGCETAPPLPDDPVCTICPFDRVPPNPDCQDDNAAVAYLISETACLAFHADPAQDNIRSSCQCSTTGQSPSTLAPAAGGGPSSAPPIVSTAPAAVVTSPPTMVLAPSVAPFMPTTVGPTTVSPITSPVGTNTPCSLCADGSPIDPELANDEFLNDQTCAEFEVILPSLSVSQNQCNAIQGAGFLFCGCLTAPPLPADPDCTLCPFDKTPPNIACSQLNAAIGNFFSAEVCPEFQTNPDIQPVRDTCLCSTSSSGPTSPPAAGPPTTPAPAAAQNEVTPAPGGEPGELMCSLCADGSALPDESASDEFLNDMTCVEFSTLLSAAPFGGTEEDCNRVQGAAFLFCGCPTAPPLPADPACTLCPEEVVPPNANCFQLNAAFANFISEAACPDFQSDPDVESLRTLCLCSSATESDPPAATPAPGTPATPTATSPPPAPSPTSAPDEAVLTCSVCADESAITPEFASGEFLNDLTCLEFSTALAEGSFIGTDDDCDVIQSAAFLFCGCPTAPPLPSDPTCTICPAEVLPRNPNCHEFNAAIAYYIPETECSAFQADPQQDELQSDCQCTGSPTGSPTSTPSSIPTLSFAPSATGEVAIRVDVVFDDFPGEFAMTLRSATDVVADFPFTTFINYRFFNPRFNVLPGDYTLEVRDILFDGICCEFGRGSVAVVAVRPDGDDVQLASIDGEYAEGTTVAFTVDAIG